MPLSQHKITLLLRQTVEQAAQALAERPTDPRLSAIVGSASAALQLLRAGDPNPQTDTPTKTPRGETAKGSPSGDRHADVKRFIAEECIEQPGSEVLSADFDKAMQAWCRAKGLAPIKPQARGRALKRLGHTTSRKKMSDGTRAYFLRNLTLKA